MLIIPFICPYISFSPIKVFVSDFSAPMSARIFKFCIHIERVEVYCVKENYDAELFFLPSYSIFFPFFFLHLSLQCNA